MTTANVPPHRLVESGAWGSIAHAERTNGVLEAKDWLERQSVGIQTGLGVLFKRMAETGRIFNTEQFRRLTDDIYEFKKKSNRILCFRVENVWYLTHQYPKARQTCPPLQIERAESIRQEFLALLAKE